MGLRQLLADSIVQRGKTGEGSACSDKVSSQSDEMGHQRGPKKKPSHHAPRGEAISWHAHDFRRNANGMRPVCFLWVNVRSVESPMPCGSPQGAVCSGNGGCNDRFACGRAVFARQLEG